MHRDHFLVICPFKSVVRLQYLNELVVRLIFNLMTKNPAMKRILNFSVLFLFAIPSLATVSDDKPIWKTKIESINQEISASLISKDIDAIMHFYHREAVSMPEHHITLFTPPAIHEFYSQWLDQASFIHYEKKIYDIQKEGLYIFETGLLNWSISREGKDHYNFDGKYMTVWKVDTQGQLSLYAEIFNANNFYERTALPEINLSKNIPNENPGLQASQKIQAELVSRNHLINQWVKERKGREHSAIFRDDALYLPYYQPMKIGITEIRQYFDEHETPRETVYGLEIHASRIIDLGDCVLEFGYYKIEVGWGTDERYKGTGKSINLWKRNDRGILMIYRQIVNHD
jgi:ketosteroid isomerase-like protein